MGQVPSYFVHINNDFCDGTCSNIQQCQAIYTAKSDLIKLVPEDYYCTLSNEAKSGFIALAVAIFMILVIVLFVCVQDRCIRIDSVAPHKEYDEEREKSGGWFFQPEFAKLEEPVEVIETVFPSFPSKPPPTEETATGSTTPEITFETQKVYPKLSYVIKESPQKAPISLDEDLAPISDIYEKMTTTTTSESDSDLYATPRKVGKIPHIEENTLCPTDFESFETYH
ncbi:Oidioi.mRNA.OKI2018_I69.PAR.g10948.t1.cds [Oikopleura dioica]|uniref:Oidioi.mRNA.OKI2018_I69.PAR.g10948.t1.cds n=1 Tax=Oikopleura dioica TaxID=34765 RepID=A0ABN7RWL1_OIKDI|nr:Oidioi.mRNA.OKI2018_I69.PAR.g10948.t1.cds [Oikopleura dioica]